MSLESRASDLVDFLNTAQASLDYGVALKDTLKSVVRLLRSRLSLSAAALTLSSGPGHAAETACWSDDPALPESVLRHCFISRGDDVAARLGSGSALTGEEAVCFLSDAARVRLDPLIIPITHGGKTQGVVFFNRNGEKGAWTDEELVYARILGSLLGVFFSGKAHCRRQEYHNQVLNTAMDQVGVCIYITDPRTDRILYMNRFMKETFNLSDPEGRICWKVLQKDEEERCRFCPVPRLLEQPENGSVYRWEENNSLTGRIYENYDSLMPWVDGSVAHLQQSIDITDSRRLIEEARTDALTGLLTRGVGQEALSAAMLEMREGDAPLTVALADMNFLKAINDKYGHVEGDRALRMAAREFEQGVRAPDFCFRLSGDEFVAVFRDTVRFEAAARMQGILRNLEEASRTAGIPYTPGFCFGCFEVRPGCGLSPVEVLNKADEHMYEQKKQFHIREAQRGAMEKGRSGAGPDYEYDSSLLYDALARSTDSYIYVSDIGTGTFRYSRGMVEEFGLPGEIVENAAVVWGARIHPDDKAAFMEANQIITDGRSDTHCVEYRAKNHKDEWVWVRCRGSLQRDADGEPRLFAGFITNLGQKNKIDHITGLLNKIKFAEDVEAALKNRPDYPLVMMSLGLDGFKRVNELYNRNFGDEVLRIAAQKIQELLPPCASVYRLDGDEFGILLHGDIKEAERLYRLISESFRYQQEYDGKKYFCTLSAGAASYPDDAGTYQDLMQYTVCALEASKRNGKNRLTLFYRDLIDAQKRALELTELLRESIDRNYEGFTVVYQPQVTADGKSVVGAEALARWSCGKYGNVSPGEFIPLLEQSGLIVPFGRWVFKRAAAQCKEWTRVCPDFTVSVNLSYLQVTSDNMIAFIKNALERLELSPRHLIVEFTESCMILENRRLQELFDEIRGFGIRIAMDDFGTGYSSLGMLKTAPSDIVKIDRTFVRDILNSKFDETFIRFIVALCHDVGIKVCLEGVEKEEELELVRPMRVDYVQGFLFGRPVPPDEFSQKFLALAAREAQ